MEYPQKWHIVVYIWICLALAAEYTWYFMYLFEEILNIKNYNCLCTFGFVLAPAAAHMWTFMYIFEKKRSILENYTFLGTFGFCLEPAAYYMWICMYIYLRKYGIFTEMNLFCDIWICFGACGRVYVIFYVFI